MNFDSYQVGRKVDKNKGVPKAKVKKIFVMALGKIINKVIKYFFYKMKRYLSKIVSSMKNTLYSYVCFEFNFVKILNST